MKKKKPGFDVFMVYGFPEKDAFQKWQYLLAVESVVRKHNIPHVFSDSSLHESLKKIIKNGVEFHKSNQEDSILCYRTFLNEFLLKKSSMNWTRVALFLPKNASKRTGILTFFDMVHSGIQFEELEIELAENALPANTINVPATV